MGLCVRCADDPTEYRRPTLPEESPGPWRYTLGAFILYTNLGPGGILPFLLANPQACLLRTGATSSSSSNANSRFRRAPFGHMVATRWRRRIHDACDMTEAAGRMERDGVRANVISTADGRRNPVIIVVVRTRSPLTEGTYSIRDGSRALPNGNLGRYRTIRDGSYRVGCLRGGHNFDHLVFTISP